MVGGAAPDLGLRSGHVTGRGRAGERRGADSDAVHRPGRLDGGRRPPRPDPQRGAPAGALRGAARGDRGDRRHRGEEPGRRPDGGPRQPDPVAGLRHGDAAGDRPAQRARPSSPWRCGSVSAWARPSRRTATTSASRWSRRRGSAPRPRAPQILITDMVRSMVGRHGSVEVRPVGALELKGLPEPVPAYEVRWAPAVTEGPVPLPAVLAAGARAGTVAFVGREAELAAIADIQKRAFRRAPRADRPRRRRGGHRQDVDDRQGRRRRPRIRCDRAPGSVRGGRQRAVPGLGPGPGAPVRAPRRRGRRGALRRAPASHRPPGADGRRAGAEPRLGRVGPPGAHARHRDAAPADVAGGSAGPGPRRPPLGGCRLAPRPAPPHRRGRGDGGPGAVHLPPHRPRPRPPPHRPAGGPPPPTGRGPGEARRPR